MIRKWEILAKGFTLDHMGLVPHWFDDRDTKTAREVIDQYYQHGGGFRDFGSGFKMDMKDYSIKYPGDPRLKPLAKMQHGEELVLFYDCALLAIVQPDGTFAVTRVD